MGSADVIVIGNEIRVGQDRDKHWWAVGREGSYGGSADRNEAIAIACDASSTATDGKRRIVVEAGPGFKQLVILRVRQKPSSQFFQDDVP